MNEPNQPLRKIFNQAVEIADTPRRADYLAAACGADTDLRQRVEELLAADAEAGRFLGGVGDTVAPPPVSGHPLPSDGRGAGGEGKTFGDYELLEEIARGGMGIVYKARQVSLDRIVAVKLLLLGQYASEEFIHRFRIEASAAASLQHPNIVAIHEVGVHQGQHYFAMDFVDGPDLAQIVRNGPLTAKRAAGYVKTIAEAIHFAHTRRILHRDLKPSNVLIDSNDQPRVTDFGLAKNLSNESELTLTGQVMGSPGFMPPEQALGDRGKMGPTSDVYSLGAILYHTLTGRAPFVGQSVADTLHQVQHQEPIAPRLLAPGLPVDLETICLKCLQKESARRFASAQELAEELGRFLGGETIRSRPVSAPEKIWRWCRRKPAIASLGLATIVLLIAVGVGSPIAAWRINHERQRAENGELAARQKAYASDINLLQHALTVNNLGRAQELLNRQRPQSGQNDLRGWEWRYLWQHSQSDALFTLCQKSNYINSLTISHDGKWLAVGELLSGGISIWDLGTRAEILRLAAGERLVHCTFSPREPLLAFSTETGMNSTNSRSAVRLWDVVRRQTLVELPLGGRFRGMVFSSDGQMLATSTAAPDNQITIWRVSDGRKLAAYSAPQVRDTSGIAFATTSDLSTAAHGMPGGRIRVMNLSTGKERWTAQADDEHITTLAFSGDGKILASGSGYGPSPILLWDVASGKEIGHLEGHRGWVASLVFWPDGKTLASASADQTIRLWDVTDPAHGRSLNILRGHRLEVWRLLLLPDNKTLVSGSKDGSVCVWNTAESRPAPVRSTLPAAMAAWRFTPDSKSVLTLDRQGRVARWSGTGFQQMEPLMDIGTNYFSWWTLISQDAGWLAAGSTDGTLQVWDLHRRLLLRQFSGLGSPWPSGFLAQGEKLVVANMRDDSLQEWNLITGQRTKVWPGAALHSPDSGATFSPDERLCVTFGYGVASMSLHDMTSIPATNVNLTMKQGMGAAFSPDGRLLAAASSSGFAQLWETSTLREVATFRDFLQGVHSVAFSPDGQRLATGSDGKEAIKLWDVESQQQLLTLEGQGSAFFKSAFSPDGNILGSMNQSGILHLWRTPSWGEIDRAEKSTGGKELSLPETP